MYLQQLTRIINERYPDRSSDQIVELLYRHGLIDFTMIKALVIREEVFRAVKSGKSKLTAMWEASEKFACTYEYVRKCIYYYKDVNLDGSGTSE